MNIEALSYLHGLRFCPSTLMVDTITKQRRIHRSKRINKKWIKRYGYITIEKSSNKFYVMGYNVVAHPDMIEKIKGLLR